MDVAPGGLRYGGLLAAAALPIGLFVHVAGAALLVVAAVAAVAFHRDPERAVPDAGVLAPADGTVSVIRTEGEEDRLRVGTFMNVHNVHVNRSPLPGSVSAVDHEPGAHRPAFSKDSDRNERVRLSLATDAGSLTVTLIAGAFARRIHPYVVEGESLDRGQRIGHISFGSRVDVLFPSDVERSDLAIEKGQRVRAGETVLLDEDGL